MRVGRMTVTFLLRLIQTWELVMVGHPALLILAVRCASDPNQPYSQDLLLQLPQQGDGTKIFFDIEQKHKKGHGKF